MRKFKKINLIFLLVITIVVLVACNSTNNVNGQINDLIALRTTVTVKVLLVDDNQSVASGTFNATIYDSENESINTVTFSSTTYTEQSKEFSNLVTDATYTVKLFATVNGKKYTLDTKEARTSTFGSEENPSIINNTADFLAIKNDPTGYFRIDSDIDFENQAIVPMFTESTPFKGHIDGNGKTVKNFKLESSTSYHGIFGYLSASSSVKDLSFDEVSVTITRATDTYFGVLAGMNMGSIDNITISNCEIKFTANGSGIMRIGFLVGINSGQGKINNSHVNSSTLTMTARNYAYVGGLVGVNSLPTSASSKKTEISNCSAEVDITVTHSLSTTTNIELIYGGLVGINETTVKDSYSNSTINISTSKSTSSTSVYYLIVGGFIGACNSTALVSGSAAIANIEVASKDIETANVGGFIGKLVTEQAIVKNCVLIAEGSSIIVDITTVPKVKEEEKDEEENGEEENGEEENGEEENEEEKETIPLNLTAAILIATDFPNRYQTTYLYGSGIHTMFTEQNVVLAPNTISDISTLGFSEFILSFINSNK